MRDYIDFLAKHPSRWEPFTTPGLKEPAWEAKFDSADSQGRENIAHAWLWELNQDLASRNFVKPCAGLVGNLAQYVTLLRKLGACIAAEQTESWLVTGHPNNIAGLINYSGEFPEINYALPKMWSKDHRSMIEGVCALAPIFERYYDPSEKLSQYVFVFLHELVWHVLATTDSVDMQARSIAYKLIARLNQEYTYSGPHTCYSNDAIALAWDRFSHAGAERDWTEESTLNFIRSTLLQRPLDERIDIIVHLADGWVNNGREKTRQDLIARDFDTESIYNWERLANASVYDVMAQWLPELKGGLHMAYSAGIYLNELRTYLQNPRVTHSVSLPEMADVSNVITISTLQYKRS